MRLIILLVLVDIIVPIVAVVVVVVVTNPAEVSLLARVNDVVFCL